MCCVRAFVHAIIYPLPDAFPPSHSVQRGGRVEIIANDQGHRITPSWVAFTDEERMCVLLSFFLTLSCPYAEARIGDSAKNAFHSNPTNTVFDAKRLIGRKIEEPELQRDMKHW
jgi:endoplasmic reticulum chaperone BiP